MTAEECIETIKTIVIKDLTKVRSPIQTLKDIGDVIRQYEATKERLQ